jgi:hypothetical protein
LRVIGKDLEIDLGARWMKKLTFAVLMMICSLSRAGWEITLFERSREYSSTWYHDKLTILNKNGITQLWVMENFPETREGNFRYRSAVTLRGFDCASKEWTNISQSYYSDFMGGGRVVRSFSDDKTWYPPSDPGPGLVVEAQFKIACGKK